VGRDERRRADRAVRHRPGAQITSDIEARTGADLALKTFLGVVLEAGAGGRQPMVVHLPFLTGPADEQPYRVISDREQWFRVVMGQDKATRLIAPDASAGCSPASRELLCARLQPWPGLHAMRLERVVDAQAVRAMGLDAGPSVCRERSLEHLAPSEPVQHAARHDDAALEVSQHSMQAHAIRPDPARSSPYDSGP
jgi:hypothetical protein